MAELNRIVIRSRGSRNNGKVFYSTEAQYLLFYFSELASKKRSGSMRILAKTYQAYQRTLLKFPIGTQAIQTGLLMGSGDLIAQVFVEQKALKKIDTVRVGQFTLVGALFVGPSLRIWYGVLEKHFGSKGKASALKKVAVDQLLFAPNFLAIIMSVVGAVQGSSLDQIIDRLKENYLDVLKNNYKVWPGIQLFNFYVMPLHYQVVTVQIVAIFWNTYFSWKINQSVPIR